MKRPNVQILCMLTLLLSGCHADHVQSAMHPAGPASREVFVLWWLLFGILAAVFVATMLILALGLALPQRRRATTTPGETRFVVIAGIIVPAVILVVLLIMSLRATLNLRTPDSDLTIHITGHQWWWHVEYPEHGIVTANEFYIPVGKPVVLKLESADVIHSLWVPNLTTKMDLLPDHVNTFWIQADRPGTWRGQCAEFCGLQHARMALMIVALEQDEFDQWVAERQQATPQPPTDLQQRGFEMFFADPAGCNACHAIRDTPAEALLGPDLTHIASRLTLGAATVPNTRENLEQWILNSHVFKPGNLMPPTEISEEDLEALVEYLMTLE